MGSGDAPLFSRLRRVSVQNETQNRTDHDDKSDQIDDVVHNPLLPCLALEMVTGGREGRFLIASADAGRDHGRRLAE
jgi:hypothetical protein